MNDFPSRETVEQLRRQYPRGVRVESIRMEDPYTILKPGDRGTVGFIDCVGTVFCIWDNNSTLGVVYGADEIVRVSEEAKP